MNTVTELPFNRLLNLQSADDGAHVLRLISAPSTQAHCWRRRAAGNSRFARSRLCARHSLHRR